MPKELLFSVTKKDFQIDFFSGTGAGGQHRNKHQNCVRIKHFETGIIATGQSNRERKSNIKEALSNLAKNPKFRMWSIQRSNEIIDGKTIEEKVEEMLSPENLKIEIQIDGKWELENGKRI
jgi:peptide chain release factor 1